MLLHNIAAHNVNLTVNVTKRSCTQHNITKCKGVKAVNITLSIHTAILDWPLSSAATKEVQGPDTTGRGIQGLLFLACWWCMGTICIF